MIRCDFNVPIQEGMITDCNRIVESLPTISYAIQEEAKVILLSHLGRVKTKEDRVKNSLRPVALKLEELLQQKVTFIAQTRGTKLENAIAKMKNGEVLLIENTRFEDIYGNCESHNDPELGAYWASLGDIFINDAFGTAHRNHASNVGIASHLPSGVGFLVEKELHYFEQLLKNPEMPYGVILGGSKVSDKIGVIEQLITSASYLLIGGGMMFTFLKAKGYEVGTSILEEERIPFCKDLLNRYPDKIILPVDVVCSGEEDGTPHTVAVSDMKTSDKGMDIGPKTIALFEHYLAPTKTVVWNGPMGVFELESFANGTKSLIHLLEQIDAVKIIGGGDTASAVLQFGNRERFDHISTGGGASLELLEGKILPALAVLEKN